MIKRSNYICILVSIIPTTSWWDVQELDSSFLLILTKFSIFPRSRLQLRHMYLDLSLWRRSTKSNHSEAYSVTWVWWESQSWSHPISTMITCILFTIISALNLCWKIRAIIYVSLFSLWVSCNGVIYDVSYINW